MSSHFNFQISLTPLTQDECTPPKCGTLSVYTNNVHIKYRVIFINLQEEGITTAGMIRHYFILSTSL